MGEVVDNKGKVFFKKGDIVRFKGLDDSPEMKVDEAVWEKGTDGKKKIQGIRVKLVDPVMGLLEKIVDTREIYLVSHQTSYFLHEAKKKATEEMNHKLVEAINKALELC